MAAKKGEFYIVNRRTGKALAVGGAENGFTVVQEEINGGEEQLWTALETKQGVKLQNKMAQKMLDVITGGKESGLTVQIWEDVDGESQFWKFAGRKYKTLMNIASGKVLDIAGMREEDGAPAQIWEDIGGENQQWELREPTEKKTQTVKKSAAKTAPKRKAGKVEIEAKSSDKAKKAAGKKPAAAKAKKIKKSDESGT